MSLKKLIVASNQEEERLTDLRSSFRRVFLEPSFARTLASSRLLLPAISLESSPRRTPSSRNEIKPLLMSRP